MITVPIAAFPGYFAGEDGQIYSSRWTNSKDTFGPGSKRLTGYPTTNGYLHVVLMREGKRYQRNVAPLICVAFHGPRPVGMEVCHGRNGKLDDTPENLSWGTKSKNCGEDKVRDGKDNSGERQWKSKLTWGAVIVIRKRYEEGASQVQLAKENGVTKENIYLIVNGRTWKTRPSGGNKTKG
jgi:HNH endonuclease